MALQDKIKNVKKDDWITRGFSKSQVKRIVFFARLKAKIYLWLIERRK